MFLNKKYKFIFFSLIFACSFLIAAPAGLAVNPPPTGKDQALEGLNTTAKTGYQVGQTTLDKNSYLPTIIGRVIGAGLAFLGVVFFAIILYAGLGWILSMGNEEKINNAKDMMIAATLGLIVVLGAYAITNIAARIFTEVPGVAR